jgi:hypothetical protein
MADATCAAWGCDRAVKAKGWCLKHYRRVKRHGDPSVRAKGDSMTSNAVHLRLGRAKGPADQFPCYIAWCDEQAKDWAYDHSDPDPLVSRNRHGRVFEYSADFERYIPLCRSHHSLLDRALHCSYG